MRLLFTSPVLEFPASGGPQLRVENSIKALSRIAETAVISRAPLAVTGGSGALEHFRAYTRQLELAPSVRGLSSDRYVRKAQRIFRALGGRDVEQDAGFILERVRRQSIDIVWFSFGNISFPLIRRIKTLEPRLKVVCDTDSVWSRFILRELPYAGMLRRMFVKQVGSRKEAEERQWVGLCDVTTAVSEVDAAYYRGIASDPGRVHIFSNGIDLAAYQPQPPPIGFRRPSMYLAGTFGRYYSPMDAAARWVLDEILPRVRERIPNIHFYIVGSGSDRTLSHRNGPNVTVTGKLPSVLPYLCNADVALVPLKYESGTRFKILEAGACRVPLVSTTLGAEGIPVRQGKDVLLADAPENFAAAIVKLVEDRALAARLAENCRSLVEERYSIEALAGEARDILRCLTVSP